MRRFLPLLAFAVCVAIWGSTWLVIKVGLATVGPFTAASLRFLLTGILLVPVVLAWPAARLPRGRDQWLLATFVGVVLFAADYGLIYWGEQFLDSGLTAVLFATMPLFTLLAANAYIPLERLTANRLVGVLLGVVGVAVLFWRNLRFDASLAWPMAAIVASALCAAVANVATKRHGGDVHPAGLTLVAALVGGAVLGLVALVTGEGYAVPVTWAAWSPIAYLAAAGSVVTFLLYFWLLKRWTSTGASFVAILVPVVAVLLGKVVLDEALTWGVVLGTGLIVGGVAVANARPRVSTSGTGTAPRTAHRDQPR